MSELRLPTRLVIAQAAACREALIAHLAGTDGEVQLDGSAVEEFDTAGLQLLLSALRTATEARRGLRVVRCSVVLRRALDLAKVGSQLGVPSEAPPEAPT
jgi:anti-anti-sigma regulatory factor